MFKFNDLKLTLGMVLEFYTSVIDKLKIVATGFWRLTPTLVEFTGEKLVGDLFVPHLE